MPAHRPEAIFRDQMPPSQPGDNYPPRKSALTARLGPTSRPRRVPPPPRSSPPINWSPAAARGSSGAWRPTARRPAKFRRRTRWPVCVSTLPTTAPSRAATGRKSWTCGRCRQRSEQGLGIRTASCFRPDHKSFFGTNFPKSTLPSASRFNATGAIQSCWQPGRG